MSIDVTVPVTIARVEVSDGYLVEVAVTDPTTMVSTSTWMNWLEAEQFAAEILAAVAEASALLAADQAPGEPLGADLAPSCRECGEGKHGACNGLALVEVGESLVEQICGCSGAAHAGGRS